MSSFVIKISSTKYQITPNDRNSKFQTDDRTRFVPKSVITNRTRPAKRDRPAAVTVLVIDYCDLPFDFAQGGEPVEPFVIWCLGFGI